MNVICAMALTSAQLDEHPNRPYVVVTFLTRILHSRVQHRTVQKLNKFTKVFRIFLVLQTCFIS